MEHNCEEEIYETWNYETKEHEKRCRLCGRMVQEKQEGVEDDKKRM